MLHLHIGLSIDEAQRFTDIYNAVDGTAPDAYNAGDSWDTWGEVDQDDPARHVVVTVDSITEAESVLRMLKRTEFRLQPMTHDYQAGVLAVISDYDDWSMSARLRTEPKE